MTSGDIIKVEMIDVKGQSIEEYLKRKQQEFIDEAIQVWDNITGGTVSYPVFIQAYVLCKFARWIESWQWN